MLQLYLAALDEWWREMRAFTGWREDDHLGRMQTDYKQSWSGGLSLCISLGHAELGRRAAKAAEGKVRLKITTSSPSNND